MFIHSISGIKKPIYKYTNKANINKSTFTKTKEDL